MFKNDEFWLTKLAYFASNFTTSTNCNFIQIFFTIVGYSTAQIGILQALPCVCGLVATPFWGFVSDKLKQNRKIFIFTVLTAAIIFYSLQWIRSFYLMCVGLVLFNFQMNAVGVLLDKSVLSIIEEKGSGDYGKQRMFGAVGFGSGAYIVGIIINKWGISWQFNTFVIMAALTLIILISLPEPNYKSEEDSHNEHSSKNDIWKLFHRVDMLALFTVVLLIGLVFGVISSFLTLNMFLLSNNNPTIVGIEIFCETLSEIPVFFFADSIVEKLGISKVLTISVIGYFIRVGWYYYMSNPWTAIPFAFLHGVTFALFWTACTKYIYFAAPKGTKGTAIGLLSSVFNGLGRCLGTLVGGWLYTLDVAGKNMWFYTNFGTVLALVGVLAFDRIVKSMEKQESKDESQPLLEKA